MHLVQNDPVSALKDDSAMLVVCVYNEFKKDNYTLGNIEIMRFI